MAGDESGGGKNKVKREEESGDFVETMRGEKAGDERREESKM